MHVKPVKPDEHHVFSGELKIAEVISRFSDVDGFIDLLEHLGFDFVDKVCICFIMSSGQCLTHVDD